MTGLVDLAQKTVDLCKEQQNTVEALRAKVAALQLEQANLQLRAEVRCSRTREDDNSQNRDREESAAVNDTASEDRLQEFDGETQAETETPPETGACGLMCGFGMLKAYMYDSNVQYTTPGSFLLEQAKKLHIWLTPCEVTLSERSGTVNQKEKENPMITGLAEQQDEEKGGIRSFGDTQRVLVFDETHCGDEACTARTTADVDFDAFLSDAEFDTPPVSFSLSTGPVALEFKSPPAGFKFETPTPVTAFTPGHISQGAALDNPRADTGGDASLSRIYSESKRKNRASTRAETPIEDPLAACGAPREKHSVARDPVLEVDLLSPITTTTARRNSWPHIAQASVATRNARKHEASVLHGAVDTKSEEPSLLEADDNIDEDAELFLAMDSLCSELAKDCFAVNRDFKKQRGEDPPEKPYGQWKYLCDREDWISLEDMCQGLLEQVEDLK